MKRQNSNCTALILMENNENYWVLKLKKGDEDAYRYLYDCHYTVLCHMAETYVHDHFEAESIVSDTIFHLWEIRETLDIHQSLRSYLLAAVRNRCLNFLNGKSQRLTVSFSALGGESATGDNELADIADCWGEDSLLAKELEHEVNQAVSRLPEECKRVFVKSRFEEKTYAEIARELGISENTVKYHIKNALRQLVASLGNYLPVAFFLIFDYPPSNEILSTM